MAACAPEPQPCGGRKQEAHWDLLATSLTKIASSGFNKRSFPAENDSAEY